MAEDSKGQWMVEDSHTGQSAREGADEIERIDLDALTVDAPGELAAGGTVENQLEGLAVDAGPFGHDVGGEAAVVVGREVHGTVDCRVDVYPVGPDVPGEPDVEQVFEGSP